MPMFNEEEQKAEGRKRRRKVIGRADLVAISSLNAESAESKMDTVRASRGPKTAIHKSCEGRP